MKTDTHYELHLEKKDEIVWAIVTTNHDPARPYTLSLWWCTSFRIFDDKVATRGRICTLLERTTRGGLTTVGMEAGSKAKIHRDSKFVQRQRQ